jgi:CRP/FNR family cyclic AMP-dependent transcriptional regulator
VDLVVLEKVPLFSSLEADALDEIERMAVRKSYRKNTIIIEQGDDASTLFLLIKGRVKVFLVGDDGREMVFGERGPGSHIGELALLAGGKRSASVQTLEDSDFLVLTRESFHRIVTSQPTIALSLLRDLAQRTCDLSDEMGALALLDVYGRIRKLINSQVSEEGGRQITTRLTHQDIADRVGSSREMVSKILKDLRAGGYIEIDKKRIEVLKPLPERW